MGFAQGFSAGAQVRQNRDAARAAKKARDEELMKQGYAFDESGNMSIREGSAAQAEQLAALEAVQLSKALQGKLASQETDKAFEDFAYTGDANYLQRPLDKDPVLKNVWAQRGVQMIGNIDFAGDKDLLAKAGLEESYYDTEEKQNILKKNMYKVYNGQEWQIGLLNNAAAETGAVNRLGPRRAEPILKNQEEFVSLLSGPKVSPYTAEGHKYEKEIMKAAEETGLPPNLIATMGSVESSGDQNAISRVRGKEYTGFMQVGEDAAREVGIEDRNASVEQNILAGARYLKKRLDAREGNLVLALADYNAGLGVVDKYGGVPPYGETQNYINKIMANFDQGEQYYGRTADSTINTILNYRRGIANASQGKTNDQIDTLVNTEVKKVEQEDTALKLKGQELDQTRQIKEAELAQNAEDLAIKREANRVKVVTEGLTTTQKDLAAADRITTDLLTQYGGEDQFFNTNFSDPKEYNKAYKSIVKIEQLEGTELTEADKKAITDVRRLIAISDPASKLGADSTGLIDKTLADVEAYLVEASGNKGKIAYSLLRNSFRNAMFGAALSQAEIDSFNQSFSELGQKLVPALESMEVALTEVQAKLDSSANLMNPYSAKVRLGADQKKLISIRDALQQRINFYRGELNPNTNKADKKSLDSIFKG